LKAKHPNSFIDNLGFKGFNSNSLDLFPEGMDLKITDLVQESIGECFFAAACISILNVNPRVILRSMKDLGSNRVAIKLFSDKNESFIYELQKTRFCLSSFWGKTSVNKHKVWANMLMKAYAVHKQYMLLQGKENFDKEKTLSKIILPLSSFIIGGRGNCVFKAILGSKSEKFNYRDDGFYSVGDDYRTKLSKLKILWEDENNQGYKEDVYTLFSNGVFEGLTEDIEPGLSLNEKVFYKLIYGLLSQDGLINTKMELNYFGNKIKKLRDEGFLFKENDPGFYKNLVDKILSAADSKQKIYISKYNLPNDLTKEMESFRILLKNCIITMDVIFKLDGKKNDYLINYIKDLKKFHENGNVISFGTKDEFFGRGGEKIESKINGFATCHAYGLLRINERNPVRGNYALKETTNTIMVCNPWQEYAAIQNRNGEIFERKKAHLKIEKKYIGLDSLNEINLDEKDNDYSFTTMMDIHESETQEDGVSEIDAISFFKDYFDSIYQGEVEIHFKVMNIIQYIIYFLVQGEFVAYKHLEYIINVLINKGITEKNAYIFLKKVSLMSPENYDYKYRRDDFYTIFMSILRDTSSDPEEDFKYLSLLLQNIRIKYSKNKNKRSFNNEYICPFAKAASNSPKVSIFD
jgi:hypothetical protein